MAYVKGYGALGVTRDQQKLLIDIPAEQLQKLPAEERLNLVLRRQEVKASESQAFWNAVSTFAMTAVPIAAALGISWAVKGK